MGMVSWVVQVGISTTSILRLMQGIIECEGTFAQGVSAPGRFLCQVLLPEGKHERFRRSVRPFEMRTPRPSGAGPASIYLSGPMTGLPDLGLARFKADAAFLRGLHHSVVSPVELNPLESGPHPPLRECLTRDLAGLMDCAAIALQPGWEYSRGACAEAAVALVLSMAFYRVDAGEQLFEAMERPAVVVVRAYPG
jgi:hypothetical protein